jgi:hypothetical protein
MLPCFASLKQKPMDFQNYYLFPYVWALVSVFKYIWDIRKKEQQMFFFYIVIENIINKASPLRK